jgi:hypothetical protein
VDRRTALSGGDWIGRSPEWVGDGEAPATEEADDVDYFDSWRPGAPGLAMGLTDVRRRRLGVRQQLVTGGMARRRWKQQEEREHAMEQSGERKRRATSLCQWATTTRG